MTQEDFHPLSVTEFAAGMLQAIHNKENPKHRCNCQSLSEMIMLHFEAHKKEELEK